MEDHTEIGKRILQGSESPLLQLAESIAWTHHEKVDGCGYPRWAGRGGDPARGGGSHFDPEVLDAFMAAVQVPAFFTTRRFSVAQPQRILHGC